MFLVPGLDQATKHGIAGMAQVGVFAPKDDVVHVWTIDREVNVLARAALGIGTNARVAVLNSLRFKVLSNPDPLKEILCFDIPGVCDWYLIHWDSVPVKMILDFYGISC